MPVLPPDRQPVIAGAGQLRSNTERRPEAAREPADLIVAALRSAAEDAGAGHQLIHAADALTIINVGTWAYDDLPGLVCSRIGADPGRRQHTDVGGNRPAEALDAAAARIAAGESSVELIAGGEAAASLLALQKAGLEPPWSHEPGGRVKHADAVRGSERMWAHGLMAPVRVYPLYENALRESLGQSFSQAQQWSAAMLSDFTAVAADHPAAWNHRFRTPQEIATVTPDNRYICFPYPLLMNSFPMVDQAAAVVVTSLQVARDHGVPDQQLIHVWGGAGASDTRDVLDRPDYDRSPGLEHSLSTALDRASIEPDDIDVIDLYACFPVVPKLAALALGLPRDRRVTITGGNTAFGGPGNNFSMHAIVSVTHQLRSNGRVGLVYANGEYVTKHHAILLSADPHPDGYVGAGAEVAQTGRNGPPVVDRAEGPATIETWTVEFDREGKPLTAYVIGRLPDGSRFAANGVQGDAALLNRLVDEDRNTIGQPVLVRHRDGRNLVSLP
jgi:acetyl-CoA C-acetyltransferase